MKLTHLHLKLVRLFYRYSIFGLGSSEYPHFCAFADKADKAMDKLGCHRLLPLATGDAAKNQEADFRCVSSQYTNVRPAFFYLNQSFSLLLCGYLSDHDQTFTSYYLGSLNLMCEVSRMRSTFEMQADKKCPTLYSLITCFSVML